MRREMGDLIIVVPGTMGSTLYRDKKPVWEPTFGGVAAAVASGFGNILELQLPDGIGDDHAADGVSAEALITGFRAPFGIWTYEFGYAELLRFLTTTFDVNRDEQGARNLRTFPYDWRLSNRYNATKLAAFVDSALGEWRDSSPERSEAKAIFICHSMGGLIARWYLDHLGGGAHTTSLITIGTPHRGAMSALDQVSNGVRKGPGPFKLNLTDFARSLPSLYQLLPAYACMKRKTGLVKITEGDIADLDPARARDAMQFHTDLDVFRRENPPLYSFHPILGMDQPTLTTGEYRDDDHIHALLTIKDKERYGDGTVPRLAATPFDVAMNDPSLHYVADNHAGLVRNRGTFDQLEGILTAEDVVYAAGLLRLRVAAPDLLGAAEKLSVAAQVVNGDAALELVIHDETGAQLGDRLRLRSANGAVAAEVHDLTPGAFQLTVRGAGVYRGRVASVSSLLTVMP